MAEEGRVECLLLSVDRSQQQLTLGLYVTAIEENRQSRAEQDRIEQERVSEVPCSRGGGELSESI